MMAGGGSTRQATKQFIKRDAYYVTCFEKPESPIWSGVNALLEEQGYILLDHSHPPFL